MPDLHLHTSVRTESSAEKPPDPARLVPYDETPLKFFHLRVAVAATGGVFSDGFGLGIVGIALGDASAELALTPLLLGLLGGSSLTGLFLGALLTGRIADRFGRRPVFVHNMWLLAVFSLLQLFVRSSTELMLIRLMIGITLGSDYVVSKALLSEISPRRLRGRILGSLSIAWASGYVCAYCVGYFLVGHGPDAWRWMLITGAGPALLILPLRFMTPESPLWLANNGQPREAARIVRDSIGADIAPPITTASTHDRRFHWWWIFSPAWRRHTFVACTSFTCQVIPYFALGTFIPNIMSALNVRGSYLGGLFYNLLLLIGAALGLLMVDRIRRRSFLVGSFAITSATMLALSICAGLTMPATTLLFSVFAGALSALSSLIYVYLPELFPTELRASGIGLAVAASRIGSAVSTFLMPILLADLGVRPTLAACAGVLAFGAITCFFFAPETKNLPLIELDETSRQRGPR